MALNLSSLLLLVAGLPLLAGQPPTDSVFKAMGDELARSSAHLKLDNMPSPYFIAYREEDHTGHHISARFGSLVQRRSVVPGSRHATIELRVGSPQQDQTSFRSSNPFLVHSHTVALPLEDDYQGLRRALWLGTDTAFKAALEVYAKKKALLENKKLQDETPDFSPAKPTETWQDGAPLAMDAVRTEALAREVSAVFRAFPAIIRSGVTLDCDDVTVRYLNSEGTRYRVRNGVVKLQVTARTQAKDGAVLEQNRTHFARTLDGLPDKAALLEEARQLAKDLTALREAPAFTETYNGPVLFEGVAAAQIFSRVMTGHLVATKRPILDGPGPGYTENAFQHRIGARVLPTELTVTDEPALKDFHGFQLMGGGPVDDEGVAARTVVLIDHGQLKALLTSRTPSPGFLESTGSRHGGPGPAPSNLIVKNERGLSREALRAQLLKAAADRGLDYGLIVRDVVDQGGHLEPVMVKLFPDGHEQPVRNAAMKGVSSASFRTILAAGDDANPGNFSYLQNIPGEGGRSLMGLVVPSLLFEEASFQKPDGVQPQAPRVPHPFF